MCADSQSDASASVLSSVYFEKEVERLRHANGYGGREGGKEGEREECRRGGGGTKEAWEVLEEREGVIGETKRG